MSSFKAMFQADIKRYGTDGVKGWTRRYLYYFRKVSTCTNKLMRYYYRFMYHEVAKKHAIEIPFYTSIGKGLYLGHPYNITLNGEAKLGENLNIHKGVTIGQENRGKRKGAPTIGNRVWIGINATVVGKITIGDDVMIAPGAYVNCDVPSHSIALGNPCKIIPRENATEEYINNMV